MQQRDLGDASAWCLRAVEVEAIGDLSGGQRALLAQGVIQAGLASPGSFILRQTDAGVCRYLGADRRCTVYERRPEVCRSFPSIGPRPGFCPANPLEQGPRKDKP